MAASYSTSRGWRIAQWLLAIGILVPALLGFGTKLVEFLILLGREEHGGFTVMPLLNYLLASLGFLCLFLWALLHGMFRNIEQPKYDMLDNERRLDESTHPEDPTIG